MRARASGGATFLAMDEVELLVVVNGEPMALTVANGPPRLSHLLDHLDLAGQRFAVERNGRVVPRDQHGAEPLLAGDRLEVVTFVGGG